MEYTGNIKVQCVEKDSIIPLEGCKITVEIPDDKNTITGITTDSSGLTSMIEVSAPSLEYSQNPSDNIPYSNYDIIIERDGFNTVLVRGVQVFPEQVAIQKVNLKKVNEIGRAHV